MAVRRYRVRLRIDPTEPVTVDQLRVLRGGRWEITATRRAGLVHVAMVMDSVDVASALPRAMNVVLDVVPGVVVWAEVVATDEPVMAAPRPPRGRSRRSRPRTTEM